MHKCEPTLEELYEIKEDMFYYKENLINKKKLYAIDSQIERHIKLREVKED